MLPKISVIIVVRNAVTMLEKAICSVIDQHYPNLEFIIIDGASTDGTIDVIKKYAAQLTYWHSEVDGGAAEAQNKALKKMTGEIAAFLFADDWYEPETLQKVAAAFMHYPEMDMVSCGSKVVVVAENGEQYTTRRLFADPNQLQLNLKNILFGTPLIGARFIRKTFLDRIGYFKPFDGNQKYNYSNDTEWLLRAVLAGAKNKVIDHVGYNYLSHNKSDTFSRNMQTLKRIRQEHALIAENYLEHADLTAQQRKVLQAWHRDQLVRLVLCEFYLLQWRAGMIGISNAFKKYKLKLLDALLTVPITVLFKRIIRIG